MTSIKVNGTQRTVNASPDTPLLYALRNELGVMTPKFGCGLAQCGACSVLLDGQEVRACITPVGIVGNKEVVTVEGLPGRWAAQNGVTPQQLSQSLHPVQEAWIEEQVPQCGVCQYGMMIKITELLEHTPSPTDDQIKAALTTSGPSAHLCRCGSYAAILDGARLAARLMSEGKRK